LLPAIPNCGAAHLFGENGRFPKRLSRRPIGDSPGRNCRIQDHALTAGSINRAEAPERVSHGLAAHPVGVIVLARLAVDITQQGKGLGTALLQDALRRSEQAADAIGVRAVLVHAINESARSFYLRFGFSPTVLDDLRLILIMKDLRALLKTRPR
jgi:GNAT superfamily N-acetyltransferase